MTSPSSSSAETTGRGERPSATTAVLVGATALGATVLFWLLHQALIDDAYIFLTYARTLAEHGQWGMLPGHEANSAASPRYVLLLGGLSAVLRDPMVAAGVLFVGTCVALVLGLRGLGRATGLGDRVAVLGAPLLILSPLPGSTIGMETMLVITVMAYLAWTCVRGDPVWAGLTAGVLLWLRLDAVVIVAVLLLATPALWRRWYVVIGCAAAVVTPWLVFSWIVLGSAVSDTLLIKSGTGWGNFVTGLVGHYGQPYTWAVGGVLVVGTAGPLSAVAWPWWLRHHGSAPRSPGARAGRQLHRPRQAGGPHRGQDPIPLPRDWNTTGIAGTPKHRGHYELLLTHRPVPEVTRSAGESG